MFKPSLTHFHGTTKGSVWYRCSSLHWHTSTVLLKGLFDTDVQAFIDTHPRYLKGQFDTDVQAFIDTSTVPTGSVWYRCSSLHRHTYTVPLQGQFDTDVQTFIDTHQRYLQGQFDTDVQTFIDIHPRYHYQVSWIQMFKLSSTVPLKGQFDTDVQAFIETQPQNHCTSWTYWLIGLVPLNT